MKAILLAASSALLGVVVNASIPTSYIDIHLITSFTSTGSLESGYLFRVPASGSNFGGSPPKAPKWATKTALTSGNGGSGKDGSDLNGSKVSNVKSSHPSHRLVLPPQDSDEYLCNEAKGISDYSNPAGNSQAFDPDTLLSGYEDTYILVPRGHCTFEAKARSAQRLGAKGVIVRNTLDSRYGLIDEDANAYYEKGYPDWSNTKWPVEQRDYECGTYKSKDNVGVRAEIDTSKLDFHPAPYDGTNNNLLLTGPSVDGNLCAQGSDHVESFEKKCPSERCLLTGRNASDDGSKLEACCAWDAWIRMSSDGDDDGDAVPQEKEEKITIPALFVTMENGDELYDIIVDASLNSGSGSSVQFVNIVPYSRWYPSVHYSSLVVWVLSLFTLWIAAYESAKEYRTSWKKISNAINDGVLVFRRSATNANTPGRERAETEETVDLEEEAPELEMTEQTGTSTNGQTASTPATSAPTDLTFTISDDANEDDFVGNPTSPSASNGAADSSSFAPVGVERPDEQQGAATTSSPSTDTSPASQQPAQRVVNLQSRSTTAAEQNMEINAFHAVMFIVFASIFLFVLFFFNLYKVVRVFYGLGGSVAMTHIIIYPAMNLISSKYLKEGMSAKLQSNALGDLPGCRGVYFKWIDVLSSLTGWSLGIAWIAVGFAHVQPMTNFYYWFIQDIMGICFVILILSLIHINTIMVASILLVLVFIYDVFYVFISPYIFGTSVMVDVATGGGGIDPTFCEKYPTDSRCRGVLAPLPMLLAFPWVNDYRGGFSMIGLGDIILPGLLISFAARYDASRELVRKCSQTSSIRSGQNAADGVETSFQGEEGASETSVGGTARYHYHLGRVMKLLFQGYFGPLMISYGIGLFVAYVAVWTTNKPQPALLYLVPACLGTILFLGWRRRELSELWSGPKIMSKANRMVSVAARIPATPARDANDFAETSSVV